VGGGGAAKKVSRSSVRIIVPILGRKGLVPTFAERLLEQGEEVSVESGLAIDDDLIIGNYIALHCKKKMK
jgi:hypothetical protein